MMQPHLLNRGFSQVKRKEFQLMMSLPMVQPSANKHSRNITRILDVKTLVADSLEPNSHKFAK